MSVRYTSGKKFNCLAYALLISQEQITQTVEVAKAVQESTAAVAYAQEERRLTHAHVRQRMCSEIAKALSDVPMELHETVARRAAGAVDSWFEGWSIDKLDDAFRLNEFMAQPHVVGFADRLKRTIILVDERGGCRLSIWRYEPGFKPPQQISMTEAKKLRKLEGSAMPLFIDMIPNHFQGMVPTA